MLLEMLLEMLKSTFKRNLQDFKEIFNKPKLYDYQLPKYLQFRYTFLPIFILIVLVYYYVDASVESYIKHAPSNDIFMIFDVLTHVGESKYIIVLCSIIVFVRLFTDVKMKSHKYISFLNKISTYAGFVLFSVSFSGVLGQILKFIIGRARPKFFLEYGSHYFQHFHSPGYDFASMPSGHSITIGAMFIAFLYIFPKARYLWYLLIVILAGSRVIVGAHYPSDVIFGVVIGGYSSAYVYYWMKNRSII
ncbi:MAG: lipid A 1-phosphatase LpxE [Francisella sp.]